MPTFIFRNNLQCYNNLHVILFSNNIQWPQYKTDVITLQSLKTSEIGLVEGERR